MVDFRKLLTPETRADLAQQRDRLLSFQVMSQEDMAAEILNAARVIQDSGLLSSDHRHSYDEWAVFRVIPELARRLDPDLETELFPHETPAESERDDPITWVRDTDPDRLPEQVSSILSNVTFRRVTHAKGDVHPSIKDAADFLVMGQVNALSIAADTLYPGRWPARETPDERPPLQGAQVVACRDDGKTYVVAYGETLELAEEVFEEARSFASGVPEVSDIGRFERVRTDAENGRLKSLSIVNGDGVILKAVTPGFPYPDAITPEA